MLNRPKPKDCVERETLVRAPPARVFAALTDPTQFPTWGPERVEGVIAPGERPILDFGASGKVRVLVVALEAPRYFAYRWAQGVSDSELLLADPLTGPNTLVEFHLEASDGGTRVRVVESGISSLPGMCGPDLDRQLEGMGNGWELMIGGIPRSLVAAELGDADRFENVVVIPAPRETVHAALVQPLGWWAAAIEGVLAPGELPVLDFGPFGRIRIQVVAVEAPRLLAFRWIQGVDDPALRAEDPRTRSSTLVEFRLEACPEGTRVHQSESGFQQLPGDATRNIRRAHQAWGVILGLLGQRFAPA